MTFLRRLLAGLFGVGLAGALLTACHSTGATYYFSTSGSDANNCTSTSTPCKTLSKTGGRLAGISLVPGSHVYLKRGDTWTGDYLKLTADGTAGSGLIIVGSYGSGQLPTITLAADAAGNTGDNCIEASGDYYTITEMKLSTCGDDSGTPPHNTYFAGASISGAYVQFVYSTVKLNHVGIKITHTGDFATVAFNKVIDNNLENKNTSDPYPLRCSQQAQGVDVEGDDGNITQNEVSGSRTTTACDLGYHGSAIEVFGGSRNVITRNLGTSSQSFSELGIDDGPNNHLDNPPGSGDDFPANDNTYAWNVIYNEDTDHANVFTMKGLVTRGAADTDYGPVRGTIFWDNSIRLRTTATSNVDIQGVVCGGGCNDGSASVLSMRNNVISVDAPSGSGTQKAVFSNLLDTNYNLYHCTTVGITTCVNGSLTLGANDRTGCTSGSCGGYVPGWVNANAVPPDLHLGFSSNCNSGTTAYDTHDFEVDTVPQGGTPDRGAYEDC